MNYDVWDIISLFYRHGIHYFNWLQWWIWQKSVAASNYRQIIMIANEIYYSYLRFSIWNLMLFFPEHWLLHCRAKSKNILFLNWPCFNSLYRLWLGKWFFSIPSRSLYLQVQFKRMLVKCLTSFKSMWLQQSCLDRFGLKLNNIDRIYTVNRIHSIRCLQFTSQLWTATWKHREAIWSAWQY